MLAVVDLPQTDRVPLSGEYQVREEGRTMSWPVTRTMMEAVVGEDGCASRVDTLCTTFWNGRFYAIREAEFE